VAEPYGHLVRIADGAAQFVEACADVLAEAGPQRARRAREMRELAEDLCWDDTAAAMESIVSGPAVMAGTLGVRPEITLGIDAVSNAPIETASGERVVAIDPPARRLHLADGSTLRYDALLADLPLPELVELLGQRAPQGVREAAASLRATGSSDCAADADVCFARRVVRIHNWLQVVDIRPGVGTADERAAQPVQAAGQGAARL
jgi:hypothetical protein